MDRAPLPPMSQVPWPWLQPQPATEKDTPTRHSPPSQQTNSPYQASPLSPVAGPYLPNTINGSSETPTATNSKPQHNSPGCSQGSATKKKGGRKNGTHNYSDDDIDYMLDFVEEVLPLGANQWALVAKNFNGWAKENDRPERDQDSLKGKFDKLAGAKKPTGSGGCPDNIRRAKNIAKDILGKCSASVLGSGNDSSESENDEQGRKTGDTVTGRIGDEPNSIGSSAKPQKRSLPTRKVGERRNKRHAGATGLKASSKDIEEDALLTEVRKMSGHIGEISKALMTNADGVGLSRDEVQNIVRHEIKAEMKSANDSIQEIKNMMTSFIKGPAYIDRR